MSPSRSDTPQKKQPKDFYSVLGLNFNCSAEEIKNSYKDLMRKYHPDKNHNVSEQILNEISKEINEAYSVLKDPEKRANYDKEELLVVKTAKAEKLKEEGNLFFKQGDVASAINCYSTALIYDPNVYTIYSNRALAYMQLEDYEKAKSDCSKCIELNKFFAKAHLILIRANIILKDYEAAHSALNRALVNFPGEEELLKLRPEINEKMNQISLSKRRSMTPIRQISYDELEQTANFGNAAEIEREKSAQNFEKLERELSEKKDQFFNPFIKKQISQSNLANGTALFKIPVGVVPLPNVFLEKDGSRTPPKRESSVGKGAPSLSNSLRGKTSGGNLGDFSALN